MPAAVTRLVGGVDGGGSACRVRIRDANGLIRAELKRGAANVYLSAESALGTVMEAVTAAVAEAGGTMDQVSLGVGLAGVSSPAVAARVTHALTGFAAVSVASDAAVACLGAHAGRQGGLIVVGTGSGALAHVGGRFVGIGGRGFVLGDDGSGARIGLAAMRMALRAHDGLQPATPLLQDLMARFGHDAVAAIEWGRAAPSSAFAALAPRVVEAAGEGDAAGERLVAEAAAAVLDLADGLWGLGVPRLCLVGGLAAPLTPFLAARLRARLAPPLMDALDGALLLAGWTGPGSARQ